MVVNEELLKRVNQLSRNRECGQLIFNSEDVKGFIVFYDGKIAWAVSNRQKERLGELLLRTGKIDRAHFKKADELYRLYEGKKKFGQILLEIAGFDPDALKECLRDHTRSALMTLISSAEAAIDFKPCFIVEENDFTFTVSEALGCEETYLMC